MYISKIKGSDRGQGWRKIKIEICKLKINNYAKISIAKYSFGQFV
jgi:hypothetical protein